MIMTLDDPLPSLDFMLKMDRCYTVAGKFQTNTIVERRVPVDAVFDDAPDDVKDYLISKNVSSYAMGRTYFVLESRGDGFSIYFEINDGSEWMFMFEYSMGQEHWDEVVEGAGLSKWLDEHRLGLI